jgi:uncharacterized integral membrane protein (TIGR00698 family)
MTNRPIPAAADLFGDLLDTQPAATRSRLREYWPGLAITIVASLAAAWISEHYGAPQMLMGLLIGLAFNFANADARLHPGLGFASKTLLRWGIVLAGLQITLVQIAGLGWQSFAAIVAMIGLVMAAGVLTAHAFGLSSAYGALAGGSVAICGASAAMALAAVLGEKRINQAQLTLVLVSIAAASALAMSIYPVLSHFAAFTDKQAGWMMGASIHDVAQALGAGYSVSDEAGQTAAIVKLTRVALLAPALAVVALFFPADSGTKKERLGLPWFVVGFLLLGAINSAVALPPQVTLWARHVTEACLLLAVTATGIRSPMHMLLGQGLRSASPVIVATLIALALGMGASFLLG